MADPVKSLEQEQRERDLEEAKMRTLAESHFGVSWPSSSPEPSTDATPTTPEPTDELTDDEVTRRLFPPPRRFDE